MKEEQKDLILLAFPSENLATIEYNTTNGMEFMTVKFKTISKQIIESVKINSLLNEIRQQKLSFSFKLPVVA